MAHGGLEDPDLGAPARLRAADRDDIGPGGIGFEHGFGKLKGEPCKAGIAGAARGDDGARQIGHDLATDGV